jgi:FkbM family methyltransferase
MKLFNELIKEGDLCFDIGANNGNRTSDMLSLQAKVVCIEPQSSCVSRLHERYDGNPRVLSIVAKALGAKPGTGVIKISRAHTLSTMSDDFIEKTSKERFDGVTWENSESIEITTLDELIGVYGKPDFCKIDVEGFEVEVLLGLSIPVGCISVEFTPELKENTFQCIDIVSNLGSYMFNYSEGESGVFTFNEWIDGAQMKEFLAKNNDFRVSFGDVYMRLSE